VAALRTSRGDLPWLAIRNFGAAAGAGPGLVADQQHGQPDQRHAMGAEQARDDVIGRRCRGELSSSCHTHMTRQPGKC